MVFKRRKWTFNSNSVRVPYEGTGGYQTSGKGVINKETGRTYKPNPLGKIPEDWWDIPALPPMSKERVGYPTQKPLKLLDRIIKACSNVGDIVLDPFCGCATTCIAAEILQRNWIGIDISPIAAKLIIDRADREIGGLFPLIHRTDIPVRDAPPRSRDIKHILFGRQEGLCLGCKTSFPYSNFTIDHVVPRAKGGPDTDENLQLLCNYCNSVKGDRPMEYLLAKLADK